MNHDELPEEELFDQEYIDDTYDDDEPVSATPAWIISLSVHCLLLLIMSTIIFYRPEEIIPPTQRVYIKPDPIDKKEEKKEVKIEEVELKIDEVVVKDPVLTDLKVEVEEIEFEEPVETEVVQPKGREEAVAVSDAGGTAAFMAIGAGGGASGKVGFRQGSGKKNALGKNGGSRATETAVEAALLWFQRHQSENGMWDVDGYMDNCNDNPKCEPGTAHTQENSGGDTACTAYALLCFLGSGYEHKTPGKFKKTVKKGLDWLKQYQNKDGSFGKGGRNYENGICTMALCEAYAMTGDKLLKEPAQRAIDNLLARQNKTDKFMYGCGWDYKALKPTRNDSSVTGWCVMALKAAKSGGLDVGDGWEGSKAWLENAWLAANPGLRVDSLGSDSQSTFCYTYDQVGHSTKGAKLECVGAVCSVFLGKKPGDGILDSLVNTIMAKQIPQTYPCNTYYLYYNTLAMFQYGGDDWKEWNRNFSHILIDAQHGAGTGCFKGSWDYEGTKFHGHEVGRLLSTAYCCLSLQVYYRYKRITDRNKRV